MKVAILAVGSILLGTVFGIGVTVAHFQWNPGAGEQEVALNVPPSQSPHAKVEIDNQYYDFGTMERGAKMSHAFVFTNSGSSPLELEVLKTSCKCTVGSLETDRIAPGESADVILEWNAQTLSTNFRHGATLRTNDPNRPRVEIVVQGKVIQSVVLDPPTLVFGKAMVDEDSTGEVRLLAFHHDAIQLLEFEPLRKQTAKFFDVQSEPLTSEELEGTQAKSGLRIRVTIKPGMMIGRFQQWLELSTNMAGRSSVPLQVRGMAAGPISVSGQGWSAESGVLVLGGVKSSEGMKRELRITVRGDHRDEFKFTRFGYKGKGMDFHLSEKKPLGSVVQYILYLEIPKGAAPVNHMGGTAESRLAEILLETNHPLAKRMKIPVSFAIEP